jgi:iron complex outermembrane recepter protein
MLATTIIAGMSFVAPAFAQTATPPLAEDEVVVVTGTRIQTPGTTSSSPITSVGAAELEFNQSSEVEKVLRDLPITVPGDGENTNNGTAGATTVNLRDLGAQRNLIMIDGKRVTPYNINGIVDISIVPSAMLERVDIVTGGASAVYGSDAISGAINFVLKRNFEGVEANYETSTTGVSDGRTHNASLAFGSALPDDRGNVAMAFSYAKRDGVQFGARDYGRVGVSTASGAGLGNTGAAEPANCSGPNTVPTTFGGSGTTVPARINSIPGNTGVGTGTQGLQVTDNGGIGPFCNQFNFNPYNYYQTPQERFGGVAYGNYKISDTVEAYGRLMYSAINVRQQIAPSGVFAGTRVLLPLGNPFLSAAQQAELIARFTAGRAPGATTPTVLTAASANPVAGSWYDNNGNGVVDAADTVSVTVARRTIEFGERSTTYDNNAFQMVFGLRGTFFEDNSWNWDFSFQHGESDRTNVSAGYTNIESLKGAINSVSAASCIAPTGGPRGGSAGGVQTATCVPINLFGPAGSITPAQAAYSSASALEQQGYTQTVASASISGPLFGVQSPFADSPVMLALGAEYREEEGNTVPDECLKLAPSSCLGGAGGNTLPIVGGFSVEEFYGEAIIPLATGKAFAESLDVELGYRYSNFDPTGPSNSWKAGFNWAFTDSLRLRVMQQKAVRAPNVGELAAPLTSGLDNAVRDPCSTNQPTGSRSDALRALCVSTGMTANQVWNVPNIEAGQINIFSGTNLAALPEPEEADTTTIGLVFTPSFLPVLKRPVVSLDYYKIAIEGYIGELSAQEILDLCYTQGNTAFCPQIIRLNGTLNEQGAGVQAFTQNLTSYDAEGFDLNVGFGIDLESFGFDSKWGSLTFSYAGTVVTKNVQLSSPVSTPIDCLGFYGNTCGNPSPVYRHSQRTTWSVGDLNISALWRHIGETEVEESQVAGTFAQFRKIKAHNYVDLFSSYSVNNALEVSFGIRNIAEKKPPIVGGEIATTASNGGNTFPQVYDPLGRVFTLGINVKF